jgi:hypothetical protein
MLSALKKEERKIDSRRIQFEFSLEAFERLEKLKEDSKASSYAEVVRDALRVYEWVLEEKNEGNEIGAIRGKEIVHVVKLLI